MSYLEIYNENIRDLLDPSSGYLELRDESGGRNIQVQFFSNQFETYKNSDPISGSGLRFKSPDINIIIGSVGLGVLNENTVNSFLKSNC